MNPEFLNFLLRFGPILWVVAFIAFLAIPVALFMIWAQLSALNEQFRVRQTIDEARRATTERPSASAPRQPLIARAVEPVDEKVDEKRVAPTIKPQPPRETNKDREDMRVIARALDARFPKAPLVREPEEQFFLLIDQQSTGPFSRIEVLRRLRECGMSRSTLCRSADTMDWAPVETLTPTPPDDSCSVCGRPAGQEDVQPDGTLVCAQCRKFAPQA